MSQQHTSTPLPANGNRTQGEWRINPDNRQEVIGQHGIVIAQCETFDLPTEETAHNAAFIVKCVNAHAELVSALNGLLKEVDDKSLPDNLPGRDANFVAALQRARKAVQQ